VSRRVRARDRAPVINTAFATVLKAVVKDLTGNPVPGIAVTFAGPGSGASGSFAGPPEVLTDASGVATAPSFVANGTTGSYTVTASAVGATAAASFMLTNTTAATASAISVVTTAFTSPSSGIAQNTWVEIQGTNLVPATTPAAGVDWSNAPDFAQGRMPTTLNGISVTINGKPAYIYFFCSAATSPICTQDQINVLSPLDAKLGPGSCHRHQQRRLDSRVQCDRAYAGSRAVHFRRSPRGGDAPR
jgi:hypothetical protein